MQKIEREHMERGKRLFDNKWKGITSSRNDLFNLKRGRDNVNGGDFTY